MRDEDERDDVSAGKKAVFAPDASDGQSRISNFLVYFAFFVVIISDMCE